MNEHLLIRSLLSLNIFKQFLDLKVFFFLPVQTDGSLIFRRLEVPWADDFELSENQAKQMAAGDAVTK